MKMVLSFARTASINMLLGKTVTQYLHQKALEDASGVVIAPSARSRVVQREIRSILSRPLRGENF